MPAHEATKRALETLAKNWAAILGSPGSRAGVIGDRYIPFYLNHPGRTERLTRNAGVKANRRAGDVAEVVATWCIQPCLLPERRLLGPVYIPISRGLRNGCRYALHRRCWGQHEQSYTDDGEHSYSPQFSALDHIAECLRPHKPGVDKARPCGKGDETAIRRWAASCQQQENAEGDIKTKHHCQCRLLPHKDRQGVN